MSVQMVTAGAGFLLAVLWMTRLANRGVCDPGRRPHPAGQGANVPNAKRLGGRADSPAEQTRLARAILGDHLACLVCMCRFLVLWLGAG